MTVAQTFALGQRVVVKSSEHATADYLERDTTENWDRLQTGCYGEVEWIGDPDEENPDWGGLYSISILGRTKGRSTFGFAKGTYWAVELEAAD